MVRPEGWHNWNQPDREKTARYAEHGSKAPGRPRRRVPGPERLSAQEADALTSAAVLAGGRTAGILGGGGQGRPVRESSPPADTAPPLPDARAPDRGM